MKYLGIDFGGKRIGLAVAKDGIAFPRSTIPNNKDLLASVVRLATDEAIECIVIGDTRSFGGHENLITEQLEEFIHALEAQMRVPIIRAPEAGSSVEASLYAPEAAGHDDAAAAAVILQRYIDMHAGTVD